MSAIDKAVILAAGLGNRISAVGSTPKPLLPLSGRDGDDTFLDFHLRRLAAAGVREVFLVGNARTHETPLRAMADLPSTTTVRWILNPTPDLSTSGSGHSLQYAWHSPHDILDGTSRVLFMDADIVYGASALDVLAAADRARSVTLVAPRFAADSEEVVVFADQRDPRRAVRHGKGLHGHPLVEGLVVAGEATGVVLLAPGDHAFARAATDWAIGYSTAKARTEHEDITQLLMSRGRIDVVTLAADAVFMEVDTPADYARLTGEVWPRLREVAG